jgi:cyclopropane-fatty-acyl-phospholipid synthase
LQENQFKPSNRSISNTNNYQASTTEYRRSFGKVLFSTEKMLLSRMMRAIGDPPLLVKLWNGQLVSNHAGHEVAQISIHDRGALMKIIANPELNFGEMYAAQRVEVHGNLLEFLDVVYRVWPLRNYANNTNSVKKFLYPLYDARRNSLAGSRKNIHHHYDIGNDFYQLWLDKNMLYTCAYFPSLNLSLEQAQTAKMDHVCRKLRLQPGEMVIEAGCGWGALAIHMAKNYAVSVKAYNISHEQISYARQRAELEGVQDLVEFIEDDYRNVQGKYDVFVSVGMLEHVGTDNYTALGSIIDRSLTANGRGLIHSIGLNFPRPMDAWTERRIFPGANPPSLAQMMQIFEPYDFSVLDVENLRLHYAQTLEHWLQRFEAHVEQVATMFDEEFVRTWRLYLAGSLTAFRNGGMQLFQISFTRAGNNELPLTRDYLYQQEGM